MSAPRGSHVIAKWQPRQQPTHLYDVASQSMTITFITDLGIGLGSMGFTPIYDALRTSWITLIYDENLRTSREGIHDDQYMTFPNFVIDVIL
jgi:hypothetical protein